MIHLSTIGPVTITVGNIRVPPANQQVFSALLYLIVERGKPVARKHLVELFFADAPDDAGNHSLRQLIYRLRRLGAPVEGDQTTVCLPWSAATWDVEALVARGVATDSELTSLAGGYLGGVELAHSEPFDRWVDEHRNQVAAEVRRVLVRQLAALRERRRYRPLEKAARACLAIDPLNEEATLAVAEGLAMAGAKAEAIRVLDQYLDEVGTHTRDLRVAPQLLRERISEYILAPEPEPGEMVGRERELENLTALLEEAGAGSPRGCVVSGPSGIGKTRLLNEVCARAALLGHSVVRVRTHRNDSKKPLAILRDLGPAVLELPGSIGASAAALATLRGLCGLGPSPYTRVPVGAFETQEVVTQMHAQVLEVIAAVAEEQPLVISVEDAHWVDGPSLQLLAEALTDGRAITVLIASQRELDLPCTLDLTPKVSSLPLRPLNNEQARQLLQTLFSQARLPHSEPFSQAAVAVAAGVPFYLHTLFHNYQLTGDPNGLPQTLSASLSARLDGLSETGRDLFDAIVVLGPYCSESRLERVTEQPRYLLIQALRQLEEGGFVRATEDAVIPSHDLLTTEARRRMSPTVARILHRATADCLERDNVDAHIVASHWELCGEYDRALSILVGAADNYLRLGRPAEGIALLDDVRHLARSEKAERSIDISLVHLCRAAGEDRKGVEASRRLGLYSEPEDLQLEIIALEFLVGAGEALVPFLKRLQGISGERTLDDSIRARAARLILILAEDLSSKEVGREALALISDIDPSNCIVLGTQLIYETVFGSSDAAQSSARQLRDSAVRTLGPGERVLFISNAGLAMWRCGDTRTAIEYCEEAYELAEGAKVWSACTAYAAVLASMHWGIGSPSAPVWFDRASRHFQRSPSADRGFYFMGLGIMMALDAGDPAEAARLLREAERLFPRIRDHRMGLERLAFHTRIEVARGNQIADDVLSALLQGHFERRDHGLHDIVADTVVTALRRVGRMDEAKRLRDEYLQTHRKDRFPLAPGLRALSGE